MTETDLRPLQILASAIAGRSVELAPAATGARTWTDGRTIFLETEVDASDRLRLLGVQASLLAGGSLAPEVVAELRARRSLAERYLAVEGHRALAANDAHLPRWMQAMTDWGLADRVRAAGDSLDLARRDPTLAPAWSFGTIDARRISAAPDLAAGGVSAAGPASPAATDLGLLDELADDDGPDLGTLLSSPVGGGGAIGRLLARLLRPGRSRDGGGQPGADAPTHLARGKPGAGRTMASVATAGEVLEAIERGGPTVHVYPEWDEHRRAYRPSWCHVVEELGEVAAGASAAAVDGAALRRAVSRLGTGFTSCRRRRQGDDLDVDAVVEARVGLLTGGPHTDEVYIENLRRRRDLSVLVLLDVSGSAGEPGVAGRTVHEHQRDAAAALTTALHRLGDRVGLYAFSSSGRKAVRVTRVKGFADRLDGRTFGRLDSLRPGAFTRLGAAIRHGSAVLEAQGGTPRRLLVVLSDGFAYDHGYEGGYGEADARRALLEARRSGIGCLCLSVGADADLAALRRVFGPAAHAAVPATDHLPALIGPLFSAAVRSAEAQRVRFQRTERTRERRRIDEGAR